MLNFKNAVLFFLVVFFNIFVVNGAATASNIETARLTVYVDASQANCGQSSSAYLSAPCQEISLCNPGNNMQSIHIQNATDPAVEAKNIRATLPPSWGNNVTQARSNCDNVAPGGVCRIQFIGNSVVAPSFGPATIPIKGDNTNAISILLSHNFAC